jgi:predicted DNA-binding transcriptional regulator YafY
MNRKNSEEKIRASRILRIDEEIRSGRYPNGKILAEKLEVTKRTVLRDIDYLRYSYDAPIEYDFKRRGYYYTSPNFFIKSIILTEGELFSVALFDELLKQYRNTPLETSLKGVFKKILAAMPENITVDSAFLPSEASFIPDPPVAIQPEVFEKVFTALKKRQTIKVEYRRLKSTQYVPRTLDPYHAICQRNYWYILAWCHEKDDHVRLYSLSRMKNPCLMERNFEVPGDFRPEDYFDREMGVFTTDKKPYRFEFLIDRDIASYAMERTFHHTQELEQLEDGSVRVSFETTQINEVLRWALGQGRTVKILNPPELIDMVKNEIETMRGYYS